MTFHIVGCGFQTELDALPHDIVSTEHELGDLGSVFATFRFREAGRAEVWVEGAQIGMCRGPQKVSVTSKRNKIELVEDTILIRPPGSETMSRWEGGFEADFFFFSPPQIEHVFHCPLSRVEPSLDAEFAPAAQRPVLNYLLTAMSVEAAGGSAGGKIFFESLGTAALSAFMRPRERAGSLGRLSTYQAKIILEFIDASLTDDLSLIDLANTVDLSVGHLVRAFKLTFGATPYQYIMHKRTELALRLLRSTTSSVEDVARQCGFGTRRKMSRTLKSIAGSLPRHLR